MVITTRCSPTSWRASAGTGRCIAVLSLTIPFLIIDLAFFGANIIKVDDGGWFPLLIGAHRLHR